PTPASPKERSKFEKTLSGYNASIDDDERLPNQHSRPSMQKMSDDGLLLFERSGQLVPHYHKYDELNDIINQHLLNDNIEQFHMTDGSKHYQVVSSSPFFLNSDMSLADQMKQQTSIITTPSSTVMTPQRSKPSSSTNVVTSQSLAKFASNTANLKKPILHVTFTLCE
ncbi:unnamed protein product, partial [Didymodactylos carnosus]